MATTATEPMVTIKISQDTWRTLNQLRGVPGETFEIVIRRLLDERHEVAAPQNNAS